MPFLAASSSTRSRPEVAPLRRWLDSRRGMGDIVTGLSSPGAPGSL
jgi:hypothetical protein